MSKNQSCVNTCEHYEERSRHGARAHHREGSDVCKQCAAAAAAAGRISRHGFDPWVEATGAPTWPVEPLREYVAVLCDRPERHAWRSRSSPKVPPTSAPAASAGALARFGEPLLALPLTRELHSHQRASATHAPSLRRPNMSKSPAIRNVRTWSLGYEHDGHLTTTERKHINAILAQPEFAPATSYQVGNKTYRLFRDRPGWWSMTITQAERRPGRVPAERLRVSTYTFSRQEPAA